MCCKALSRRGMSSLDLASKVMAEISISAQLHLWVDGLAHNCENSLFWKIFEDYYGGKGYCIQVVEGFRTGTNY